MFVRILPLSITLLAGCAPITGFGPHETPPEGSAARTAVSGSPEGVGLVDFLNDAGTSFAMLDNVVPLEARAARNLIARRDGADRKYGTSDDKLFDTVEEVDAVAYVGTAAMDALLTYVEANGWVPTGSDTLGTWDGVTFTVDEAATVVAWVNGASLTALDDDAGLDRRSATSIASAAASVDSIQELSLLYYVGNTAMDKVKSYALAEAAAAASATACEASLTPIAQADADDYSRLVALATTTDYPYGAVEAFTGPACRWMDDATTLDTMTQLLWAESMTYSWADAGSYRVIGSFSAGGGNFSAMLLRLRSAVEDRVTDGDWDPASSSEATDLYDRRDDLIDALSAGPTSDPSAYEELTIEVDASEASESATILVHIESGTVLVVHQFPRA